MIFEVYHQGTSNYSEALTRLARRGDADLERVEPQVRSILARVREQGDQAVLGYIEQFESRTASSIRMDDLEWQSKADAVPVSVRDSLAKAAERIRRYHEHQKEPGFRYHDDGVELGQRVRPLKSVGVYAPGGKAKYPSSVLMTAIPAAVAGVRRIVLASPNPPAEVLAAAQIAGVTEVLNCGGAHAVAALAYGTASLRAVDKIVGPGNLYVACAKRLVFGTVDIDSIAGPSEILVVADEHANPAFVAADLLSQAEHDEDAYALLIAPSASFAKAVSAEVKAQLASLPRKSIAAAAMQRQSACFVVEDLREAGRVADALAAEHLALHVQDPDELFAHIESAGAVFLGAFTPEATGDYAAGPSHVLPTGGAARFASPLGVYDFVTRTSIVRYSFDALKKQAPLLQSLAELEGLDAHARAVSIRTQSSS
jgi:histidinol dehydrogenase